MGLLRKGVIGVLVALFVGFFVSNRRGLTPPLKFGGNVQPGFEAVEMAFRQNFEDGYEPDGAAFAVCLRGKLVVDLWGGYADKSALRPWERDTMTMAFSTTKSVTALTMAVLVDRGLLSYDDLVTKYWPEFGGNGKDNITIKMILSHTAGLAALDEPITLEVIRDWRKMSRIFEDQVPHWPPGRETVYHAYTIGWLCDQLVRRVDPKHRSLGQFFNEEVAKKFDIDFFIGLPRKELYRMARMTLSGLWDWLKRLDWSLLKLSFSQMASVWSPLMQQVIYNPNWLDTSGGYFQFNNPDVQEVEVPGANGIGTARGLAQLYCLLDGSELISKSLIAKISQPEIPDPEVLASPTNLTFSWGLIFTTSQDGHVQLGHPGYGGQSAKFDPREHLAFAYLRSNMAPDMLNPRSFQKLETALYESIKNLKNK